MILSADCAGGQSKPRGVEALLRLVDESDVLIENFRPDVLEKLGFGWQVLQQRNPRLIYCSITGFGADGPYAAQPCYDTVAQSQSGYLSQFIDTSNPRVAGPAVADALTGMYAAQGVLGALFERASSGRGRRVEVAMLDSMIAFTTEPFSSYFETSIPPGPLTRSAGSQAFALECSDGKFVAIHLSSPEKFWRNLISAIGHPALADDPRFNSRDERVRNYASLGTELKAIFRGRSRAYWIDQLGTNDVPHSPVATLDEVPENPQVRHRDIFETIQHPTQGAVKHVRRPILIDGKRTELTIPPPTLGEHTDAILGSLGFAISDIESMRRDGVV